MQLAFLSGRDGCRQPRVVAASLIKLSEFGGKLIMLFVVGGRLINLTGSLTVWPRLLNYLEIN